MTDLLDIFLVAPPGLEQPLADEAQANGFKKPQVTTGGVTIRGTWREVWRANLCLRGPTRVLVRIGGFRSTHLAHLDKQARQFPFGDTLRRDVPVKVETTTRKSKIYHAGAATQRIETALGESHGITIDPDADVVLKARIDSDRVTFSLDSSGESLHKRGHKEAIGKAPMRENMAALFLRDCGYKAGMALVDPMCGSGTFPIEAAEISSRLLPGRSRSFAFEQFASFDPEVWSDMRAPTGPRDAAPVFFGSDRDQGAIHNSTTNAQRAGVDHLITFSQSAVSDLQRPDCDPGLVMVNPPYGARIGNKKLLYAVYGALGKTLMERFSGWRVGMVTSEPSLAKATGLPLLPPGPPVPHGGLRITCWKTEPLK